MRARPPSDSQQQMRSCSRSRSLSQPTWRARKMHGDAGEATPRAEATGGGSGSAGGSGWESAATVAVGWVLMEEEMVLGPFRFVYHYCVLWVSYGIYDMFLQKPEQLRACNLSLPCDDDQNG